jgi:hypothetical protein
VSIRNFFFAYRFIISLGQSQELRKLDLLLASGRSCTLLLPVICVDLMDDKSKKGKEKDGSASAPPDRRKASFSPTNCLTYKFTVLN